MASATVCGLSLVPVSAQVGTQKLQGGQADGSYPSESQEWGFWSHSLLHLLRLRWPSDGDPVWKKKTTATTGQIWGFGGWGGLMRLRQESPVTSDGFPLSPKSWENCNDGKLQPAQGAFPHARLQHGGLFFAGLQERFSPAGDVREPAELQANESRDKRGHKSWRLPNKGEEYWEVG